jgi:hypothetical protein
MGSEKMKEWARSMLRIAEYARADKDGDETAMESIRREIEAEEKQRQEKKEEAK